MPNLQNPYKSLAYDYQPLSDQAWKQASDLSRESTRSYLGSHGLSANSPLGASLNARSQDRLASDRANTDINNQLKYTQTMSNMYSQPGALKPTGGESALAGGMALAGGVGRAIAPDIWSGAKAGAKNIWDKMGGGMSATTPMTNPYSGMGGYGYGDLSYSEMPGMGAQIAQTPFDYSGAAGAIGDTGALAGEVAQGVGDVAGSVGDVAGGASDLADYTDWWDQLFSSGGGWGW